MNMPKLSKKMICTIGQRGHCADGTEEERGAARVIGAAVRASSRAGMMPEEQEMARAANVADQARHRAGMTHEQ